MILVGLTGQIGTGKTFALNFFKSKKIKTFSADEEVKKVLKLNYIQNKIYKRFPNVFKNVVIHTIPLFIWIEYIYYDYQYQLTILTFVFQFIVSIISSQFLFYWAHRMMHTKYLKKYH